MLNAEVQQVMRGLAQASNGRMEDDAGQRALLDRLCHVTATCLKLISSSHFRFSASEAYAEVRATQ